MDNQNTNKIRETSVRLSTVATSTRQTPKTDFGTLMRDGLVKVGSVTADGLSAAAPFIPGGAIVSAALAGANAASGMAAPSYGAYGAYHGESGGGGVSYGSSASGLSAAGSGPSGAGFSGSGTLAIPGRGPTYDTPLSGSSQNYGGASGNLSGGSDAFNNMMSATKQMSEMQASFNLQYLQLQEKIQIDTRQFNLISNIMKAKHDAAKNALNNVR